MQKRRFKSISILLIYLFVVVQSSVASAYSSDPYDRPSHSHDDYTTIHHEHHFHIGVFHFLKHLLESIEENSGDTQDHLEITRVLPAKKLSFKRDFHKVLICNVLNKFEAETTTLINPPDYLLILEHSPTLSSTRLRGPPTMV